MKRDLWHTTFSRHLFPAFPCPRCEEGAMQFEPSSLKIVEPHYSSFAHGMDGWEPDWIEERFSATMLCTVSKCGEVVNISGDTVIAEVVDDNSDWSYEQQLRPKAVFPGLPIIFVHEDVPAEVSDEIEVSFSLFWMDLGACASRLRTSVERILDDFKIPAVKAGGGFLPLNDRIKEFKKIDPTHAETFDALRHVGNVGTHEDELKREALLDAFEIYEDALDELFVKVKHKAKIDMLKKKIIAAKGKYK